MGTLIILTLIAAGLILLLVEVFLIPGISIAGIASCCCFIYVIYYAFSTIGTAAGIATIAASTIGIIASIIWFMKSKAVDKLSLHKTIDYKPTPLEGLNLSVGDTGITTTRLTLIGNAEFSNHIIEVQSADGFIDEKTPVEIYRIVGSIVYVKQLETK